MQGQKCMKPVFMTSYHGGLLLQADVTFGTAQLTGNWRVLFWPNSSCCHHHHEHAACPELERSCFHELLPTTSILSESPR